MIDKHLEQLANHLNPDRTHGHNVDATRGVRVANLIADNPQAHMDALERAGLVLKVRKGLMLNGQPMIAISYVVMPPILHDHDWRVVSPKVIWCIARGHKGGRFRELPQRLEDAELPKWEGEVPA